MGGVKRPAEGSKEEPSEKKNLPVVAKSFASKNGTSLPSTLTGQTAPAACGATAQVGALVRTLPQTFESMVVSNS